MIEEDYVHWSEPVKVKEALDTIPESMWDEIDAAADAAIRPANSFTRAELQQRKGLTRHQAESVLASLITKGVITKHGSGNKVWYQVVRK